MMEILIAQQMASGLTYRPKYMKAPLSLLSGSPEEYPAKHWAPTYITHGWHTHQHQRMVSVRGLNCSHTQQAWQGHTHNLD